MGKWMQCEKGRPRPNSRDLKKKIILQKRSPKKTDNTDACI